MAEVPGEKLNREEIIKQIKGSTKDEMDKLLIAIIKEKLSQEKNQKKLYEFFTYIYDNLYHDIIFKRISLNKQIISMLETLSMPVYDQGVIDKFLYKLKIG